MCVSFIRFCYVEFHIFVLTNLRQTRFDHLCWCKTVVYCIKLYSFVGQTLHQIASCQNFLYQVDPSPRHSFQFASSMRVSTQFAVFNVNLNNLGLGSHCLTGTCYR